MHIVVERDGERRGVGHILVDGVVGMEEGIGREGWDGRGLESFTRKEKIYLGDEGEEETMRS